MNPLRSIISALLLSSGWGASLAAQSPPPFVWARQMGGVTTDTSWAVAVNPSGQVHVVGAFRSNATFLTTNFTSAGSNDVFVAKFDNRGELLWARQAGGVGDDTTYGVAVDRSNNVFICGEFHGTATFGTNLLAVTNGIEGFFVAKYNSEGDCLWARSGEADVELSARAVGVDATDNAVVTGYFSDTLALGSNTLPTFGGRDVFIARYDSAGNLLWVTNAGGTGSDSLFNGGLTVDDAGNSWITGNFDATANFGGIILTNGGGNDPYLAQFNSAGQIVWARRYGSATQDYGRAIARDQQGQLFVAGHFSGTTSLGGIGLTAAGNLDAYVMKLDASGNPLWARKGGGLQGDRGYGVGVDGDGVVFLAGLFQTNATFDTVLLTAPPGTSNDIFVARYGSDGTFLTAQSLGSPLNDELNGLAVDSLGNAYLAGWFAATCDFGGGVLLATNNSPQAFVAKLGSTNVPPLSIVRSNDQAVLLWPLLSSDFYLETTTALGAPTSWTSNSTPPTTLNFSNAVVAPLSPAQQFFRLRR